MNQGLQQRQVKVNTSEATMKNCENCNGEYFKTRHRMCILSAMAASNPTGKDIPLKAECYICENCGHEFGKPVIVDGKNA